MIRFEDISKIYSTDIVLKNINWEIKKVEKVGLVGSNGAGKSTQFKILIGEEDQTTGMIIKEGNPKIAYLRQELECNLNCSVREELESSFKDIQTVTFKLLEIENQMKLLEIKKHSAELETLVNQLAKYQAKFEALGGYKMQSDVEKICDIGNELNLSVTKEEVIEYLSTIDDEATKMWLVKARGGL